MNSKTGYLTAPLGDAIFIYNSLNYMKLKSLVFLKSTGLFNALSNQNKFHRFASPRRRHSLFRNQLLQGPQPGRYYVDDSGIGFNLLFSIKAHNRCTFYSGFLHGGDQGPDFAFTCLCIAMIGGDEIHF